MGVAVSGFRVTERERELQALSNPAKPVYYNRFRSIPTENNGVTVLDYGLNVSRRELTGGSTTFGYRVKRTRFDTGRIVVISYTRNQADFGIWTMENQAILRRGPLTPADFTKFLHQLQPLENYLTYARLSTIDGSPRITITGTSSLYDLPYNVLPYQSAKKPSITISDLVAPSWFATTDPHVKVVSYKRELYLFNNYGDPPRSDSILSYDKLICEAQALCKLASSKHILPISFFVTDAHPHTQRFRGYLQPFLPAGSLQDVVQRVYESSWANVIPEPGAVLHISWQVKHTWFINMARGLMDLHHVGSYIGYLTPHNFWLDTSGVVQLRDISTVYDDVHGRYAAPEFLYATEDELLGMSMSARDVYGLGIAFWEISEEMVDASKDFTMEAPIITWAGHENGAPLWFQDLVADCTHADPDERPRVFDVISRLFHNL